MSAVALSIEGISRSFGALRAVDDFSLAVPAGQRRAIIGPNGAGKTTLFNLITGDIRPQAGRIVLNGEEITERPPEARAGRGLGRTFQRTSLFSELTPFESVRLAVQRRLGLAHRVWQSRGSRARVEEACEATLADVGLTEVAHVVLAELSYGFQRQTEIAVALAMSPSMLLLDEPTAGLSVAETTEMIGVLRRLPESLTMVIVEHDMDVVFALGEWISVMHQGRLFADGPPEQIQGDSGVQSIYFG